MNSPKSSLQLRLISLNVIWYFLGYTTENAIGFKAPIVSIVVPYLCLTHVIEMTLQGYKVLDTCIRRSEI